MKDLRQRFLKVYANLPIPIRDEIIAVLSKEGTVTWNVAYLEIHAETELSKKILEKISELDLI